MDLPSYMEASLIADLETYGFTDKEARVYLTCLELGTSLASTIARRAEVNRGTTYSILQDFQRRGIANETIKADLKYFSVIRPELLFRLEEEKYEHMKSCLPELLAVTEKFGNRPKTQFFE
jgi:sugar-specific transcriptional regulator TrmB